MLLKSQRKEFFKKFFKENYNFDIYTLKYFLEYNYYIKNKRKIDIDLLLCISHYLNINNTTILNYSNDYQDLINNFLKQYIDNEILHDLLLINDNILDLDVIYLSIRKEKEYINDKINFELYYIYFSKYRTMFNIPFQRTEIIDFSNLSIREKLKRVIYDNLVKSYPTLNGFINEKLIKPYMNDYEINSIIKDAEITKNNCELKNVRYENENNRKLNILGLILSNVSLILTLILFTLTNNFYFIPIFIITLIIIGFIILIK